MSISKSLILDCARFWFAHHVLLGSEAGSMKRLGSLIFLTYEPLYLGARIANR